MTAFETVYFWKNIGACFKEVTRTLKNGGKFAVICNYGDPKINFAGLSFSNFIWAVLAGNVILGLYTGLLAYPAAKTGLSVHLLSRYSFGVAMFAIPAAWWLTDVSWLQGTWFVGGVRESFFGAEKELPLRLLWTLTIVSGIVMTSSAYFGIKALHVISVVSVPAIAILGGWSAIQALFFDSVETIAANNAAIDATAIKSGWDVLVQHQPASTPDSVSTAVGMVIAISLGIGSFVSGGSCTPRPLGSRSPPRFSRSSSATR